MRSEKAKKLQNEKKNEREIKKNGFVQKSRENIQAPSVMRLL